MWEALSLAQSHQRDSNHDVKLIESLENDTIDKYIVRSDSN
jgi:hypothetical protein